MTSERLFSRFAEEVKANPELFTKAFEEAKEQVRNSSARYLGEPIDFLYQPMFFTPEDLKKLEGILDDLTRILTKTINRFKCDEKFRELFPFTEKEKELALLDPGYEEPFPIGRFDLFYDFENPVKFCEFNTDGSSGMNEARVLQEVFSQSPGVEWLKEEHRITSFDPMENLIEELLKVYRDFTGSTNDPERIAIVDFEQEGVVSEFREFKRRFESHGYPVVICDPRELDFHSDRLLYEGKRIDLIYRRATTGKILEHYGKVEDFLQAYRERSVCVVGGFTSQIVHNKALFAILQKEDYMDSLTKDERDFISRHFPQTLIYDEQSPALRRELQKNKDEYILKPFDKFAGHGVFVGKDLTQDEWRGKLDSIEGENYIVQEFCDVPEKKLLHIQNGEIRFEKFGYIVGCFLYNQNLSGLYTRAGRENIIASLVECFTVPNLLVEKK